MRGPHFPVPTGCNRRSHVDPTAELLTALRAIAAGNLTAEEARVEALVGITLHEAAVNNILKLEHRR